MYRKNDRLLFNVAYAVVMLLTILLLTFRGFMADEGDAKKALETAGYSYVHVIDRNNWMVWINGCGGSDAVAFHAKAKNPAGRDVKVMVCMGWPFKGSTVRMQ